MPRGNGTGPMGMGPMTGNGAGYCKDYTMSDSANYGGIGFGRGMCGGRGFRKMFYFTGVPRWARNGCIMPDQEGQVFDERIVLKNQAEFLEAQLKHVKDRLKGFNEEK